MTLNQDLVDAVNLCSISEMEKDGRELDPKNPDSCTAFAEHVTRIQVALMHTYQIVAYAAVREPSPVQAAEHWKKMARFCDLALTVLKDAKERFPSCGTSTVYDLALDYKLASDEHYNENQRDSECLTMAIPTGLFPKQCCLS